jgi:hypothetical protein
MQRRQFIKKTIITSAGLMVVPYLNMPSGATAHEDNMDYEHLFLNAPDSARPWVFYMWMNGNVTKEGITLDLEAMKRMGVGGFINFNSAVGIPRGPVDYASTEWIDAVYHQAAESSRLGLDMFMHNSPGYSGCGGPWITPQFSMQELVWTEKLLSAKEAGIDTRLEKPYAKQGFYRDAFVIAYPSLPVEKTLMKDQLAQAFIDGREIDKNIVCDGNPETKIRLIVKDHESSLLLKFLEPFEARAIEILRKPEVPLDLFDGPRDHPPVLRLESSDDGVNFKFIGRITCVELRAMDTPSTLSFNAVVAKYYRLTSTTDTWLSEVKLHNGPRLGGWPGKTSHTHGSYNGDTPHLEPELVIDPQKVLHLSDKMDPQGNLKWNAPIGNWTILRIGHTSTGEYPAAHPAAAGGLEIDMYNRHALDQHFEKFLDPLLRRLSPFIGKSMKGVTVDSWEAGKQNWTAGFPEEFKKTCGYDITQWMPALTGRIVGGVDDTERFLWDVRKTHADLIAENFYGYYQECCHKRGLQFNAEPYGDGVFDSLQVGKHLDTPMSEFWTRYIYGSEMTSKQAASLAHIYGRKVAAAESFTSMPANSKWTDYPYSMKAEGDYFFTLGINRLVFHVFVHQPYKTAKPGMTMGPFGSHMDRNNTWAEQAYGWTGYLKRTQNFLQQGLAVVDACYFKGNEPASGIPDVYEWMPNGYVADVVGADGLDRFRVQKNLITLPDGMTYKLCILARLNTISPQDLNKLKNLVADGMILVVSNKPQRSSGRHEADDVVIHSINELYGNLDGDQITQRTYGKGKVIWKTDLKDLFSQLSIAPDFECTAENRDAVIHFIHKKLDGLEYYFITNHLRRPEKVQCSLRVSGMQPEVWNSQTGEIYDLPLFQFKAGRTNIALELEPAGSVFLVFRKPARTNGSMAILQDGRPYLSTSPYPLNIDVPFADTRNTFTISSWIKPDSFAQDLKSMLFHPPEGELLYGSGHVAMAIGAGQNGIKVYERGRGKAQKVLADDEPVQGWTFITVVYQNGAPKLFVNGKHKATGKASNKIVHPGLLSPTSQDQYTSYFEGNYTTPQMYKKPLTDGEIAHLYQEGMPVPERSADIILRQLPSGRLEAEVFKNGNYTVNATGHIHVSNCLTQPLNGKWQVWFSKDSGIISPVELPQLTSLHNHRDFNVRHFSGTANYHQVIQIPAAAIGQGKKTYIDLGNVEVIAEVRINGTPVGISWKEPYRLEVTGYIKAGKNQLEVSVTTLWPNRLIGDEYLPEENSYNINKYIERLPDWYVNNQPKPGERKTFTTWKNFDKNSPLLESGLLGPVRIINSVIKIL